MSDAGRFAHLHVHTEFSMLDGASRVEEAVAAAAADGQPALGITDHGNMYGVLPFYSACKAAGITPIIGFEAYQAHDNRYERINTRGKIDDTGGEGEGGKKPWYHLTLLAENNAGYKNLIQLASRAFLEGYYRKPKVDWEILAEHSEGVIATTGCLGGHVLQSLLKDDFDTAFAKAGRLQEIFGKHNLFVELQDHGIPEQHKTNPQLVEIARRLGAPILATNDSHYTHPEDAESHDALLCVQTNALISQSGDERFKFSGEGHYLKTAAEMRRLFSELPDACDNTLLIAERANVEIEFGKPQLPNFDVPAGFADDSEYLRHLTMEGAKARWGSALTDTIVDRLNFELKVIDDMGFSSYFLIVWDLIKHARDTGIRVGPGRGSAAGCAVAYCLRITDLDPIKYDLLFERFLNPSRISMPDIDMDFDSRYRDEMIRYAAEKYGRDHVAQIVTFSTIKARAAVRDAARVLGYPYGIGDKIAKAMPPLIMGRDTPLKACLDLDPKYEDGYKMAGDLRSMYETDPDCKRVMDVAKGLENLRRQDGIHAAAVVITKEKLTEYLPIQRKPDPGADPESAPTVTQYEMHGVEDLGLLKMDFLGLRNLDVLTDTVEIIKQTRGVELDIDNVPLDDEPTFELLRRADTMGVFQLEGGPMRALIRSLAPTSFEDVAALVALYRPGPMAANIHYDYADRKNGRKPIDYFHPDAAEVLGDTQGLIIFQEDMMRVAQKFAGYSLAEADNLRKACFPAGTLMLTKERGYLPIEKVMRLRDRRVQTVDIESSTSRFECVEDVWGVGEKPVYRLTTSSGYTVEATANHPFLVEGEWRELGHMQPGDLVAVAARTATEGNARISDAEIDLAALLISEGYTPDVHLPQHRAGHFCNTDPELLHIFRRAFKSRFGYDHSSERTAAGVTTLRLNRTELLELEPVLGGFALSEHKRIPRRVVNASTRKLERFLGLYFCADGWSDRSGMHFASKSVEICRSLKRMLLRFGITSNLHSRVVPGHGRHWTLSIADGEMARALYHVLQPHMTTIKREKARRWLLEWRPSSHAQHMGVPSSFLKAELARRQAVTGKTKRQLGVDSGGYTSSSVLHRNTASHLMYSERLHDVCSGDLTWDTVVSIEYIGERECFDFRMANPDRPHALVEDFLAHNCGKKVRELMAKERDKFVEGVEKTGYGRPLGTKLFDIIEQFADYAFGKSHSYGYGYIAYQTAFLKANYPAEYMSALLTSVKTNLDKAAVYLADCRAMNIEVTVPDVNRSASDFTPVLGDQQQIVFGLSAVRNVGEGLVSLIIAEREKNGPFIDFYDFCERVDINVLNKRTIESLIKAGGFDSMGHPRKGLLLAFEAIIDQTVARRRERDMGVMSLFGEVDIAAGGFDERPKVLDTEFDKMQRLGFEKEMLGLYVSDHPLLGCEGILRRKTDGSIADLGEFEDTSVKVFGGIITGLQRKWTKRGELMAVFTLEDLRSSCEVMVFPKTMTEHGHKLTDDAIVCVKARVDKREEAPKLIAMEIEVFEGVSDSAQPLRIKLAPTRLNESLIDRLKGILHDHPGDAQVFLHLGDQQVLRLPDQFCVDTTNGLVGELRVLLGPDALVS